MKRLIFCFSFLLVSSCGYDGHYRYECQDPENWDAEECNPPLCLVDGMCTETLLGFDPRTAVSIPARVQDITEESTTQEPLETVELLEDQE